MIDGHGGRRVRTALWPTQAPRGRPPQRPSEEGTTGWAPGRVVGRTVSGQSVDTLQQLPHKWLKPRGHAESPPVGSGLTVG